MSPPLPREPPVAAATVAAAAASLESLTEEVSTTRRPEREPEHQGYPKNVGSRGSTQPRRGSGEEVPNKKKKRKKKSRSKGKKYRKRGGWSRSRSRSNSPDAKKQFEGPEAWMHRENNPHCAAVFFLIILVSWRGVLVMFSIFLAS